MSASKSAKADDCVTLARQTLFTTAPIAVGILGGAVVLANQFIPSFRTNVGWRAKLITICIGSLAIANYRSEVALTECGQKQKWEEFREIKMKERQKYQNKQ